MTVPKNKGDNMDTGTGGWQTSLAMLADAKAVLKENTNREASFTHMGYGFARELAEEIGLDRPLRTGDFVCGLEVEVNSGHDSYSRVAVFP